MPTDNSSPAPTSATLTIALEAIARGECPDAGDCACKRLKLPGQCVALAHLPKCRTCDEHGMFRMGMSGDICGDCLGTKIADARVWDADDIGRSFKDGYQAYLGARSVTPPVGCTPEHTAAWESGVAAACRADALERKP